MDSETQGYFVKVVFVLVVIFVLGILASAIFGMFKFHQVFSPTGPFTDQSMQTLQKAKDLQKTAQQLEQIKNNALNKINQ